MKYTFYNPSTGQITSSVIFGDQATADLNLIHDSYIQGIWNETEYYIQDGQAVAKPVDPSTNDIVYYFDYTTKTWCILEDKRESNARQQRNDLLSAVDRINPVWYASLTTDQQTELATYRQQLLDVPQQSGFSSDITWPAKPGWL